MNEGGSSPDRLGGGRGKGEGKPSPLWACLRFEGLVIGLGNLHAKRPEASADSTCFVGSSWP